MDGFEADMREGLLSSCSSYSSSSYESPPEAPPPSPQIKMDDHMASTKEEPLSPSSSSLSSDPEAPPEPPPSKGKWRGFKPECGRCHANDALYWRKTQLGEIRCISCSSLDEDDDEEESDCETGAVRKHPEGGGPSTSKASSGGARGRRGSRRGRGRGRGGGRKARGSGRRSAQFKNKAPAQVPPVTPTIVTSDSIFYRGLYYQAGDIVSILDVGGGIYYAQLRGFMVDENAVKSAVITWLLPTPASPKDRRIFNPSTYVLGPEEDFPREMKFFEFIMHAPHGYFKKQ